MASKTMKIQANVDYAQAQRVNDLIYAVGSTPTNVINMLYSYIDNEGKLPFTLGLSAEQRDALELQRLTKDIPAVLVKNEQQMRRLWDED